MSREQWVMILTFVSGVIGLAGQFLVVSQDAQKLLAFAAAIVSLALTTFFGVQVYRGSRVTDAEKK